MFGSLLYLGNDRVAIRLLGKLLLETAFVGCGRRVPIAAAKSLLSPRRPIDHPLVDLHDPQRPPGNRTDHDQKVGWLQGYHETRAVGPGDAIAIPPGTLHQIRNTGSVVLKFLCCWVPAYEDEDTVLEEDGSAPRRDTR